MRYISLCLLFLSTFANAKVVVQYYANEKQNTVTSEFYKSGLLFKHPNSQRTLRLVTLNWPPYISDSLCNNGWILQFVVAALHQQNYNVHIEFMPWARAVRYVELGQADILIPEYDIEHSAPSDNITNTTRLKLLALSAPFPGGALSFLKRKDDEFTFNGDLNSIKTRQLGVVRGYQNTPELDAMIDNKLIEPVYAVDDFQLVRLLAENRVDLIVGDPLVFQHSIINSNLDDEQKHALMQKLTPVGKQIADKSLHFAISKRIPHWQRVLADVNSSILAMKNNGELARLAHTPVRYCK
ncbi:transporter substrate-binding domain-containing protein [Pseudoalteromonas sp. MMG010]|uniref:substrate-binding periplasmic protein n=1 Tax=Pseudoalteromonas sp. MMG010 TaxID=2822685 RepID=UPI0032B452C5